MLSVRHCNCGLLHERHASSCVAGASQIARCRISSTAITENFLTGVSVSVHSQPTVSRCCSICLFVGRIAVLSLMFPQSGMWEYFSHEAGLRGPSSQAAAASRAASAPRRTPTSGLRASVAFEAVAGRLRAQQHAPGQKRVMVISVPQLSCI